MFNYRKRILSLCILAVGVCLCIITWPVPFEVNVVYRVARQTKKLRCSSVTRSLTRTCTEEKSLVSAKSNPPHKTPNTIMKYSVAPKPIKKHTFCCVCHTNSRQLSSLSKLKSAEEVKIVVRATALFCARASFTAKDIVVRVNTTQNKMKQVDGHVEWTARSKKQMRDASLAN